MNEWQMMIANGDCPKCKGKRKVVDGRSACSPCLKMQTKACLGWRRRNKDKHNAYMREYMRKRRLAKQPAPAPQAAPETLPEAPDRAWLLARIEALNAHL